MIKIVFNCSTNISGGGVKNSAIFIDYALESDNEYDWFFLVSQPVYDLLSDQQKANPRIELIKKSPAVSSKSRKRIVSFVEQNAVELVYTMAGPAYVSFKVPHLLGISNPYVTHVKLSDSFKIFGFFKSIPIFLKVCYQFFWSLKGDFFVFQTESSRNSFLKRARIFDKESFVVSNAYDQNRKFAESEKILGNQTTVLVSGADYQHKLQWILPMVCWELSELGVSHIKFLVTLRRDSKSWMLIESKAKALGVASFIENIGEYKYSMANEVYASCDMVFIPSVVEVFSATYLEAIQCKKPLIVADRDFAREVCSDGAEYLEPFDFKATAKAIYSLDQDSGKQSRLIKRASIGLKDQITQEERFNRLLAVITSISPRV